MNLKDQIIKHTRAMDVCFDVYDVNYLENVFKLKGCWINMGFVNSFPLKHEIISISHENLLKNWLVCTKPDSPCLRYAIWSRIT